MLCPLLLSPDDFYVDLYLTDAAVTLLALLFETGIITVKTEGICLVTDTDNIWAHLKTTEVCTDWVLDVGHPPCMNQSALDTVIFSMDRRLHCTWRTSNVAISRLHSEMKTFCGGRNIAL